MDVFEAMATTRAMRRLDAAYVVYRRQIEGSSSDREHAATTLDAEIDEVEADGRWRS